MDMSYLPSNWPLLAKVLLDKLRKWWPMRLGEFYSLRNEGTMASLSFGNTGKADRETKISIEDDFSYGSNVASAHIYIRMGFLRKVYGILSVQLLLTAITGAVFMSSETITAYVHQSQWMLLVAFIGTIGLIFGLMVFRHETPTNYILLGLFTLFEAYSIGVVVTFYEKHSVIEAFVLTLAVTFGLTVYTLQSKRDFSSWGAGLFACLWILIIAGFLQLLFPTAMMDKAIAVGGAIVFSLFIVFDTHMLMHKLSPEEYIVAAVNLYLDIINLFLHLLRLFGERKN
ncbi:hypothetical protein FSP39_004997 [Pinctada imbricata]|uniref:Transmembrane BAX inhibitor motif-containing protein 4 n=1 Tax=Pinctada imbricata TaxID=66713 RepID=A0AA88YAP6_PINIB|nr:hypothetical protein FSP39_004997 [Pinctada imbricata]